MSPEFESECKCMLVNPSIRTVDHSYSNTFTVEVVSLYVNVVIHDNSSGILEKRVCMI
jgi:hypothetical protein